MMIRTRRWAVYARRLCACAFVASAFSRAPAPSAAGREATAGETYKNIQVLRDIPASQLMPAMFFMRASLGVSCTHCHKDFVNFESDARPAKQKAREMIRMVESLNHERFGSAGAVMTCNTCHRGRAVPDAPLEFARPVAATLAKPATAPSVPSVNDLFARAVNATGGAGAWRRIQSLSLTGTRFASEGWTAPVEYLAKPGKFRSGFQLRGPWASVLNDDDAWGLDNQGVHTIIGRDRAVLRLSGALFRPDSLSQVLSDLHVTGTDTIAGRAVVVAAGTLADAGQVHLFFDASSGLLERVTMSVSSPFGELPEAFELGDYRRAGPITLPFLVRHLKPDFSTEDHLEHAKVNAAIDDNRFTR